MTNKPKSIPLAEDEPIVVDGHVQDRGELPDVADQKQFSKGILSKIPFWAKALFVNFWFAGAVYFFVGWGLFIFTSDGLDSVAILGLTLGLVIDLLVNSILDYASKDKQQFKKSVMFKSRNVASIVVNCVYGLAVAFLITLTYGGVNLLAINLDLVAKDNVFWGAEPIGVGLLFAVYNLALVTLKNLCVKLLPKKNPPDGQQ